MTAPRSERPRPGRALIGLIVDHRRIAAWQAEALRTIADDYELVVLDCTNSKSRRRPFRHALYYLINLVALKTPRTRAVAIPAELRIRQTTSFEADEHQGWQALPDALTADLDAMAPVAVIKFGMGLLRVPERLAAPILSYHHGDPRRFRGRPAGFYELMAGAPLLGQIIQILTNRLDAGPVLAFAETRVHRHSYRATMDEAYRCSPLLLRRALLNAACGTELPLSPSGRNHRLPGNATVVRWTAAMLLAKLKRLAFAAVFEKAWQVAEAPAAGDPRALIERFPPPSAWRIAHRPRRYRFLADPFPHGRGIVAEALRAADGQGEIVYFEGSSIVTICSGRGHFSYPATVRSDGSTFLIPEVAEWSSPLVFEMSASDAEPVGELDIPGRPRLIDPTILSHQDGNVYLFANRMTDGPGVLRLWVAGGLFAAFAEHPESPIRISPRGARMAGAIQSTRDGLFRFGQDGSRDYGDGVVLYEIAQLSPSTYREAEVGVLRFEHVKGPHTVNLTGDGCLFDFYRNRWSLLAGVRRLQSRLVKRRVAALPPADPPGGRTPPNKARAR